MKRPLARAFTLACLFALEASAQRAGPDPTQQPAALGPESTNDSTRTLPVSVQSVAVVPVVADGVDMRAAYSVTLQIGDSFRAAGLNVATSEETKSALVQVQAQFPPRPADLWRVSKQMRVDYAVGATLSSAEGEYVLRVTLAAASDRGPFRVESRSDAPSLRMTADRDVRRILSEAREAEGHAVVTPAPARVPAPAVTVPPLVAAPALTPPEEPYARVRLALQTEAAIGVTEGSFYNHLVGGRFDYRFAPNVALGGYLGYVNLKGRDGRAHNVLPLVQTEYRLDLRHDHGWQIPLRFGAGYLPDNGPVLRLSAGIAVRVSPDVDFVFDLLAPTFWVAEDLTVVSMDFAVEAGVMP